MFFLRLASGKDVTPSIYGPLFQSRWQDLTFRFCVSGYYGQYLSDFLRTFGEPFSFIDIGANIGLYSLIAANNKNCKHCYAFEPNPSVFGALTKNVKLNGLDRIQTINSAVSKTAGMLPFSFLAKHSGGGSLTEKTNETTIMVRSVNKDHFDHLAAVDRSKKILKIDVEGHEPIVISELMKSEIWTTVEYLYFECDEDRYDVNALVRQLNSHGLMQIYRNGSAKPYDLMFRRMHF